MSSDFVGAPCFVDGQVAVSARDPTSASALVVHTDRGSQELSKSRDSRRRISMTFECFKWFNRQDDEFS